MKIAVVSTAFAPAADVKARHMKSVSEQEDVDVVHIFLDAATQAFPLPKLENIMHAVGQIPDDCVVALVDGDDWLLHSRALRIVADVYEAKPETLVCYGQFRSYTLGFECSAYPGDEYRLEPWRASHLKTFRAGLFNRIAHPDLCDENGQWLRYADDLAMMFPMLEMAGPERTVFQPQPIYFYNNAHVRAFTEEHGAGILHCEKLVRSRPRYKRI